MGWRETASGLIVPDTLELAEDVCPRGVCCGCGCTETSPCVIEGNDPSGVDDTHCAWTDGTCTLCTGCA
jgi:hypothetical protein